jgi:hypothetical protein
MNGIASPQRSRSRPDVLAITSSCDVNDKGNRRAKVMPGLSGGFHCGQRNLSAGIAVPLPLYGQSLFGQRARAPVVSRDGRSDRQLRQRVSSGRALMQVKSQCAGGAPVMVGVSPG